MAQTGYTPIQLYYSSTASAAPIAGNLAAGELAINTNDGKLYYKDSGGSVQLMASKAGASGDVVGPASATDNSLVAFDGTTGKLVKQFASGTGVNTWLQTPSSANLAAAVTDETGSGPLVFANGPTLGAFNATGNVNLDGGTFTFNDSAADRDARFEGQTDPNLLFLDASANYVGIGTNAPSRKLHVSGSTSNDATIRVSNTSTSTSLSQLSQILLERTQTVSNIAQRLGSISFSHVLTDSSSATEASINVDGSNVAGSNRGKFNIQATGGLEFTCGNSGIASTVSGSSLFIDGGAVAALNNAKLGYYAPSGGTVTQATSRTTGVTLDKTNGAITLVSAAGTTSWQSFTVTNSFVAATDVVYVCQKSGTDLYEIHVTNVAAGSFQISFRTTGGTTTEQPVFNFVVLGAVTA